MGRVDGFRAAAITAVLVVHGVLAVPSPRKLDHERLGTPPWIQEVGEVLAAVQNGFLTPFRPLLAATGTGQSWGMFATPDRTPRRLEIHVETDGRWEPVFVKNREEPTALHVRLSDRRIRAVYDTTPDEGSNPYWGFSRWAGRLALAERPDASRVRVRLVEIPTVPLGSPANPSETVHLERVFTRLALFAEDGL